MKEWESKNYIPTFIISRPQTLFFMFHIMTQQIEKLEKP